MRHAHSVPVWVVAALVVAGVAACSGDDGESPAAGTSTTRAGTATSATSSTTAAPGGAPTSSAVADGSGSGSGSSAGCPGGGPAIPGGAGTGEITDVDGDGRRDTAWLHWSPDSGSRQLGIRTASGGGGVAEVSSASPVGLVVLAVDADQEPPVELLVSDNRAVQLWAFADCQVQQVIGPDGAPYVFDLGYIGTGTGVGCVDSRQGRELIGLNVISDDGTTVEWSRTVVELDDLQASNGETETGTFRQPGDADAIDLLHTVSCGDLTIDTDGVRQPEAS